jgi:hypothetical protein
VDVDDLTAAIVTRQFAFLEDQGFRRVDGTVDLLGFVTYLTDSVITAHRRSSDDCSSAPSCILRRARNVPPAGED